MPSEAASTCKSCDGEIPGIDPVQSGSRRGGSDRQ